ncbi:hypothetical protein Tco_0767461 [Tanacetum coccineum]
MLVAIETLTEPHRPTFGFYAESDFQYEIKMEVEEIPLTPPMLAIAAAGNDAADDDAATNEDNAAADEAAGSTAEAYPVPHSPPVSPVRELTLGEQSTSAEPDNSVWGPKPRPSWNPLSSGPHLALNTTKLIPETLIISFPWKMTTISWRSSKEESHLLGPKMHLQTNTDASCRAEDPTLLNKFICQACQGHEQHCGSLEHDEERDEGRFLLGRMSRSLNPVGPFAAADEGKRPYAELIFLLNFLSRRCQPATACKRLDDLMMRMTETDWLNLMMQVGSNPALARELLGADVNEDNFIERMTAIKERKKRALADLRYRALKGKPLKQSEVTQLMRNLVKNQWCAAHHGTITMKAVKAMSKQQLIEEQRVERASSQLSNVPAASTQPADDHDSAGGSSFHPAGSAPPLSGSAAPTSAGGVFGVPDSTVPTSAA